MNLKIPLRLGRILVVLALIVALLGSSISVPARAVGAGLLYNIAANTGVNLALRAIGVGPGNSPDVFNNLVTTIGEAVSSATAPLAQLLITGSSGNFRSFLSADFLSWILSWLFDSRVLNNNSIPSPVSSALFSYNGNSYLYDIVSGSASIFVAVASVANDSRYRCGVFCSSDSPFTVRVDINAGSVVNTYGSSVPSGGSSYIYSGPSFYSDVEDVSSVTGLPVVYIGEIPKITSFDMYVSLFDGGPITTSYDLALDSVGDSLDAAPYTDWVANSVTYDSSIFAPVSVPSLDAVDISAQAQGSSQLGTIPDAVVDEVIAGAEVDPDVVTLTDIFTAIRSLGADVVEAIQAVPAAIADVFSPPAISDEYMISLSDFFPFCLPFDIYDLLSALAADPQAPVFEWTIAVPRWGISHDIEIDLSEWDDIARLFRTFELGSFVLGLALITRQKFLRS